MYGKPVRGHVNLTFVYHRPGADEAVHEHMQVCEPERKQTEAPDRPHSTCLSLLQIDGTADFTFDPLGYQHGKQSHLGMVYNGHVDEDSVSVMVHVTEHLTGTAGGPRLRLMLRVSEELMSFSSFRPDVQESNNSVCCKVQISNLLQGLPQDAQALPELCCHGESPSLSATFLFSPPSH